LNRSHVSEFLQAIDRVNRLGQKKDVFVYQMVAEDTIETKVRDDTLPV
jgi:SNF2 family DNA or RNA helicase